jgi:hypothetical protein
MSARVTRRHALQLGAAGTLGHLLSAPAVSAARILGANEKIRVAGIGVGGKGSGDIEQAGKFMEVVALWLVTSTGLIGATPSTHGSQRDDTDVTIAAGPLTG